MTQGILEKAKKLRKRIKVSSEKVASFSQDGTQKRYQSRETTDDKIKKLKEELYGKDVAHIMSRVEKRSSGSSPLTSEFMKEKPTVLVANGEAASFEQKGSSIESFSRGVAKAIAEFRKNKNNEVSQTQGKLFFAER
ncbi:MAG: hypothetical protein ACK5N8_00460 [Alphaproteobacteria bacterium]